MKVKVYLELDEIDGQFLRDLVQDYRNRVDDYSITGFGTTREEEMAYCDELLAQLDKAR